MVFSSVRINFYYGIPYAHIDGNWIDILYNLFKFIIYIFLLSVWFAVQLMENWEPGNAHHGICASYRYGRYTRSMTTENIYRFVYMMWDVSCDVRYFLLNEETNISTIKFEELIQPEKKRKCPQTPDTHTHLRWNSSMKL